jgi:signal transduction histidine kinase
LGEECPLEEIQRIESFVQFEREVSEQSGLGLGLALVKKLVDIDQGEFWLESEKR